MPNPSDETKSLPLYLTETLNTPLIYPTTEMETKDSFFTRPLLRWKRKHYFLTYTEMNINNTPRNIPKNFLFTYH